MPATLVELLQPQVVLRVISRIKRGRGPLSAWLGWHTDGNNDPPEEEVPLNGPNVHKGGGGVVEGELGGVRNVSYRIFDNTRTVMKWRAPGTGPATVAPNPMGTNTVSVARFHEKIPLLYELLSNLARMAGPNMQIDTGGQAYIRQQTSFMAQKGNQTVEMLAAGMLRNSLYVIQSGDNWLPSFTAPTGSQIGFQCDFKIPAGNTGQLNMLGTGNIIGTPWNNPSAPILGNLQAIIAAYAQLSGWRLTEAWINSLMWVNLVTNTELRNIAGSSNTPFSEFADEISPDWMNQAGPATKYSAVLKAQPQITWNFCDDVLALANPPASPNADIDPSYSTLPAASLGQLNKLVPDNMAIFSTTPDDNWQEFYPGGEYVSENPGQAPSLRRGFYAWHEYGTQPTVCELISILNGIPLLYVPSVVAPAQVVF